MSGKDARRLPRRSVPTRALPLVVVFLFALAYAAIVIFGWGTGVASWITPLTAAGAAASLFYAAWRLPDIAASWPAARRWPVSAASAMWRWFALAAACWSAGTAADAVPNVLSRTGVSLSLADLFLLAAVVALATGFVVPVRLTRSARTWLRYAADTFVCAAALFVSGWVILFGGLYDLSGESAADFVLELMYPIIDAVLVCAVLPFVLGTGRVVRRSAVVAYAALVAVAVADVLTTVARLKGGAAPDEPGDLARFIGLLLLGTAPWVTRSGHDGAVADADLPGAAGQDGPVAGRDRLAAAIGAGVASGAGHRTDGRMIGPGLVPATAAGVAAVFLAGHSLTSSKQLQPVVSVVAGLAVLVLLVRLGELLWENERLRRAVDIGGEHFRALAESIDDVVLICDLDGTVRYVSAGAERAFDYGPDELVSRPLQEVIHPEDLPVVEEAVTEFLGRRDEVLRVTCRVRAADGTWQPTESTVSRYRRAYDDRPRQLLVTTRDLSEQAALQRQVTHLTFNDGLTGLPNRAYFEERVREVLAHKRREGRVAVIFADVDGFTAVNDSAGHAAGDQILAQVGRRMRAAVQVDDTVARWGGDEFAVLVENPPDCQGLVDLAERLLRVVSAEPYRLGSRGILLTASVGVALLEDGMDMDAAELMRNGDLAMARAKELGGGRVEVFAAHMHADVVRRLELASDLQRALAEQQFSLEFQPVVELRTSRVTGVEALVRWWRDGDVVPPREFIGHAEESGLMIPLGDWILRQACAEVARWRESSWDIGLSVNFTARQIAAPRFVETVAAVLAETGLPPQALTVEVKEEVLVEDAGQPAPRLSALRELGVRLAIDDFGTGYASLAYLRQLPVDVIKIDPSFVAGLGCDETLTLLTRTIVRLGHDLGVTVVAEGIERPDQLEALRDMGCPHGQGFLVARPMAARRVESLVHTDRQGTPSIPLHGPMLSAG
ncbi:MAG TPA: bifunctional diguanylate cyclase/phosphodiesterase [Streptosporangiaceae bacterium]|nr:bifunctional diguanylate cyclase/phosphodiesterase [Streptosporangiaceae bacterium]